MLKLTSVSGSVRAITDIILTGTITRTGITLDLIIDPITGRTTGTAGIVIIAIIIVILFLIGFALLSVRLHTREEITRLPKEKVQLQETDDLPRTDKPTRGSLSRVFRRRERTLVL